MLKLKRKIIISLSAIMLMVGSLVSVPAHASDFVIIMSDSYGSVSSISHKALKNLYLKKDKSFNGVDAKPINLAKGVALRASFLQEIIGMSEDELKAYWIQTSLEGGGKPPKSLGSEKAVIKYVSKKKGAIGYVSQAAAAEAGVSTVAVE